MNINSSQSAIVTRPGWKLKNREKIDYVQNLHILRMAEITCSTNCSRSSDLVAPHVGAWIETTIVRCKVYALALQTHL